jgi:serine/threonine-protein kinase RsbW
MENSNQQHHKNRAPASAEWTVRSFCTYDELLAHLDALLQGLGHLGYSEREQFGIRLALEEAMVNAVKHGHGGDMTKVATLRYRATVALFLAEVEDQGAGFNPADVPDPLAPENLERPGGRGLLLMRRYMTWVRHNAVGNCVTLCRRCDGAGPVCN